jgi:hypothetical protein
MCDMQVVASGRNSRFPASMCPETIKNLWCEMDQMNDCHFCIVEILAADNVTDGSDMVKSENLGTSSNEGWCS